MTLATGLSLMLVLGAAEPDFAVLVTRQVKLEPEKAAELAERFRQAFERDAALRARQPAASVGDAAGCEGSIHCAARLGAALSVRWVIALQLVKLGSDMGIDASLVEVKEVREVASVTGTTAPALAPRAMDRLAAELARKSAAELKKARAAPPPAVVVAPPTTPPAPATDRPAAEAKVTGPPPTTIIPPATSPAVDRPSPLVPTPSAGPAPKQIVTYGLGGAALVSVAVGASLGVLALTKSEQLDGRDPDYTAKVLDVRGTAQAADIAYVTGAGLGLGAVLVWLVWPQ